MYFYSFWVKCFERIKSNTSSVCTLAYVCYLQSSLCNHELHRLFHWVAQLLCLNDNSRIYDVIQFILLEDYYVQFHSLSLGVCLSSGAEDHLFAGVLAPS